MMKIRDRITFQFTGLVAFILLIFISVILYLSDLQRKNSFNNKLKDRALNSVRILMEIEKIDTALLKEIRRKRQTLPMEFVRVYDKSNNFLFKDDTISFRLTEEELDNVRNKGEGYYSMGDRQVIALPYHYKKGDYVV